MKTQACSIMFVAVLAVGAVGTVTTNAHAQAFLPQGTIMSDSVNEVAVGAGSGAILTTPASGHFFVTKVCASEIGALADGLVRFHDGVRDNTYIASVRFVAGAGVYSPCVSLEPGFALPANDPIVCFNGKFGSRKVDCSVTGIWEPRNN